MTASPCPCCGKALNVRADKRGHPYLTCADCGVNTLVHRKEGVEKFKARTGWTGGAAAPAEPEPKPPATGGGHAARRAGRA